jgi:hypothetical protein
MSRAVCQNMTPYVEEEVRYSTWYGWLSLNLLSCLRVYEFLWYHFHIALSLGYYVQILENRPY